MSVKSNLFSSLTNAQHRGKPFVLVPASNWVGSFLSLLMAHGLILGFQTHPQPGRGPTYIVRLKSSRAWSKIKTLSSPGKRVYMSAKKLPRSKNGLGLYVVSTKYGLLTDAQARTQRVGGEVVCEVCI
uniref:Ribosomal protein S8 n=1 Tax=Chloroparvula japonica TaxID=1411623 RepID=A0A4D6C7G3_9CHLO|nr:ribosomal protein S8 [Chloroparvula japonica]QBX98793.1 ribosomal protein S8 [Chloroparvula japonica]